MADGQKLLFEGEGDQGPDITAGDVSFSLKTLPHPFLERRGNNLYMKEVISLLEALTGFERKFVHLNGKETTIRRDSKVTQPGTRIVMLNY